MESRGDYLMFPHGNSLRHYCWYGAEHCGLCRDGEDLWRHRALCSLNFSNVVVEAAKCSPLRIRGYESSSYICILLGQFNTLEKWVYCSLPIGPRLRNSEAEINGV